MEEILKKYMNRFTTLSEEEQQMILSELQIEEYKRNSAPKTRKCSVKMLFCIKRMR